MSTGLRLLALAGLALLGGLAPVLAAGPDLGPVQQQGLNPAAIAIFAVFVLATLGITYKAAVATRSARDFYAAGGHISAGQNALAIAGDFMSAASFLGISAWCSPRASTG